MVTHRRRTYKTKKRTTTTTTKTTTKTTQNRNVNGTPPLLMKGSTSSSSLLSSTPPSSKLSTTPTKKSKGAGVGVGGVVSHSKRAISRSSPSTLKSSKRTLLHYFSASPSIKDKSKVKMKPKTRSQTMRGGRNANAAPPSSPTTGTSSSTSTSTSTIQNEDARSKIVKKRNQTTALALSSSENGERSHEENKSNNTNSNDNGDNHGDNGNDTIVPEKELKKLKMTPKEKPSSSSSASATTSATTTSSTFSSPSTPDDECNDVRKTKTLRRNENGIGRMETESESKTETKAKTTKSETSTEQQQPTITNEVQNLKIGLIRAKSTEPTLEELCTSLSQIMNKTSEEENEIPHIYQLFHGALLGRNERSNKNEKKMNIDIPMNENGVSRKQLIVSNIIQSAGTATQTETETETSTTITSTEGCSTPINNNTVITSNTKPLSLMQYLKFQQQSCPTLEIKSAPNVINGVRIIKTRVVNANKRKDGKKDDDSFLGKTGPVTESSTGIHMKLWNDQCILKKGEEKTLRVGDTIVFDAYNIHYQQKMNNAQFIYRVVAFGNHVKNPCKRQHQQQLRLQPSRRAKEMLDVTIDKRLQEEEEEEEVVDEGKDYDQTNILNFDFDRDSTQHKEDGVKEQFHEGELDDNLQIKAEEKDPSDVHQMTPKEDLIVKIEIERQYETKQSQSYKPKGNLDSECSDVVVNSKLTYRCIQQPNQSATHGQTDRTEKSEEDSGNSFQLSSEETDEGENSDLDDDNLNLSQDSFLGTPFELAEETPTIGKLSEMPPMTSNSLWRALNSAQPQNGFGILMHLSNALNIIPNNTLANNLSQFLLTGPVSDGINFKDYRRTELIGIYLESVMKKMKEADYQAINFTPSTWSDVEEILNLPVLQEKYTNTSVRSRFSTKNLAQVLQMSSTSLKIVTLNLELELLSFIQNADITESRLLYSNQPLVGLILKNQVCQSLKSTVRLATKCWMQNGYRFMGYMNEGPRICDDVDEDRCVSDSKSCLSSYGSIICYLTWLFCEEENHEFGGKDCCVVIRDIIKGEFENMDYSKYIKPGKKATAAAKRKISKALELRFVLSMDTTFAKALQRGMGEILGGLSSEMLLLGI